MWRVPAAALALLLAGCGGPREYAAPAPAGALRCALEEAEELGYERMSGEPAEAYVRVSQRADPPPGLRLEERPPPAGPEDVRPVAQEAPIYNQLLLREEDGMLRIGVLHTDASGEALDGNAGLGSDAEGHAQMILAACSG